MCKIMVMPGINDDNRKLAMDLVFEMSEQMSSESDKDGLGYVAMDKNGDLFGEKWFINKEAFIDRISSGERDMEIADQFKGMLEPQYKDKRYGSFGLGNLEDMVAICMHTRFATSAKTFQNVHPFISEDGKTGLIHNGVIQNQKELKNVYSTNDSETILHLYTDNNVMNNMDAFQAVADKLEGWYACGVFSEQENGTKILDVFKESRSNLHAVFVYELNTYVFTTKLDFMNKACENLGLTISQVYKVKDDTFARINPFDGSVIDVKSFESHRYKSKWERTNNYDYWRNNDRYNGWQNDYDWQDGGWVRKKDVTTPSTQTAAQILESVREDATKDLNETEMAKRVNNYLTWELKKEESSIIDVSKLKERLEKINKGSSLDRVVSTLEKSYGWEKYYDEVLQSYCFRRKDAKVG